MKNNYFSSICFRYVYVVLLLAVGDAQAEPQKTLSISYKQAGNKQQTEIIPVTEGSSVSISGSTQGAPNIQINDPNQPVRLLVRLKEQPLRLHMKQMRNQLGMASTKPLSGAQQQLALQKLGNSISTHRQRLQKSQAQIISDMSRQKTLLKVHHQFVSLTNTLSITATANAAQQIRQLPQVDAVYPDNKVLALLDESVPITGAPDLWAMKDGDGLGVTGAGISVAIIDTGIDHTHPDLGGCLGSHCKVIAGYNFVEGEDPNNAMDKHGHGTHVAGIVAANGTLRGVAPDAKLYAFKVLDDSGSGTDSAIIAALEKAVDPDGDPLTDDQVDVINMSLGGNGEPDSPMSQAANAAMDAGIIVVVAAGNGGSNYSTIGSPGNAEFVITVGASDNDDVIAYFSSRGPIISENYIKPELVAPGVEINSAAPGGGYVRFSGTSMATPHVAGGAALIKQLYPELNPQEVKSLLVNNSTDIGEDIFTQGAGRMNLVAAANASLVFMPQLLSAGYVDTEMAQWKVSLPITAKNISAQAVSISLSGPQELLPGTQLGFSETESIVLEPGQAKSIDARMDVNTKELPFSDAKTMHHETYVTFTVNDKAWNIPLIVIKALKLRINFQGNPEDLRVFLEDYSYIANRNFDCSAENNSSTFYVKPGIYNIVASFMDDGCKYYDTNTFVFKENVLVDDNGVADVEIDEADAINVISIGDIVGSDGEKIDSLSLDHQWKGYEWAHTGPYGSYGVLGMLDTPSNNFIKVSNVSGKFQFGFVAVMKNNASSVDNPTYYQMNHVMDEGINNSFNFDLDIGSAGKVDFEYSDADILEKNVMLYVESTQGESFGGFFSFSMGASDGTIYNQPFSVSLYSTLSSFKSGEWYPGLAVAEAMSDTNDFSNISKVNTGLLAFIDSHFFVKLKGFFQHRDSFIYQSIDNNLQVADGPYVLSSYIIYDSLFKFIWALDAGDGWGYFSGMLTDLHHNKFYETLPFSLRCDDQVILEDSQRSDYFFADLSDEECQKMNFEFQMDTRLYGFKDTSTIQVELNRQSTDLDNEANVESPIIESLQFTNDGQLSRVLDGSEAGIKLKANNNRTQQDTVDPLDVAMEYRLEPNQAWQPLVLEKNSDIYTAKIPVMDGGYRADLRIMLQDQDSRVVQTLNSVFLIGKDAKKLVGVAPVFGVLQDIVIEATGWVTDFNLPPVLVQDSQDGILVATTADLGPYSLGYHEIRWRAKNSLQRASFGVQRLIVQDTTPPVITQPANRRVASKGALTEVELTAPNAIDVVDGMLLATPDQTGPFRMGAHVITWSATDASGNVGSTTQVVTVFDPSSIPSTSGRGSNGGGSMGLLMLLLLTFGCVYRYSIHRGMRSRIVH